jgi:hypothetical protein
MIATIIEEKGIKKLITTDEIVIIDELHESEVENGEIIIMEEE